MSYILEGVSDRKPVKSSIKVNWENYGDCLGHAPSIELSIGGHLTWLVTNMPERGMNLMVLVCTELREARRRGCPVDILQAPQMGQSVYRGLGSDDVGKLSVYLWKQEENGNATTRN